MSAIKSENRSLQSIFLKVIQVHNPLLNGVPAPKRYIYQTAFFIRLISQASSKLVIWLHVPQARWSSKHILEKSIYAHPSSNDNLCLKVCKLKIMLPLCPRKFSCLFSSVSAASWVLSSLSNTLEYYFQETRIKYNSSHRLKHGLNIALVLNVLLGIKCKDSTKKNAPPFPHHLFRNHWFRADCVMNGELFMVEFRFSQQCSWRLKFLGKLCLGNW